MSALARYAKYQWAVIYRRVDWRSSQTRYFQSRRGAIELRNKLLSDYAGDYSPLTLLVVEKRPLGEPETVYALKGRTR